MATASTQMQVCAAEAHLELSNFYLSWADSVVAVGGGMKLRHLDAALHHAREARMAETGSPTTVLPSGLLTLLADAEKRALRELLRAHAAAGNTNKAANFREEYRALLQQG